MIRQRLLKHAPPPSPTAFRWRGGDVSRLEGFSDAVFGFALTLLVVSLEVPHTFNELMNVMRGFVGFAVCFALLSLVWHDHYIFFRQYGLDDAITRFLNLLLLFLVMFYVFPLKFLFTLLIGGFTGLSPSTQGGRPIILANQVPTLMAIYGAGLIGIYLVFTLMYLHAYRQRRNLRLDDLEEFDTLAQVGSCLILVSVALVSIAIASTRRPEMMLWSGLTYMVIGPAMTIYWTIAGSRRRRIEARYLIEGRPSGKE